MIRPFVLLSSRLFQTIYKNILFFGFFITFRLDSYISPHLNYHEKKIIFTSNNITRNQYDTLMVYYLFLTIPISFLYNLYYSLPFSDQSLNFLSNVVCSHGFILLGNIVLPTSVPPCRSTSVIMRIALGRNQSKI